MTDNQLKPCPFCGGKAKIVDAVECGPQAYVVQCTGCLCSSKVIFALKDDVTNLLVEAWNARENDEIWNTAIEAAANEIADYQAFTKYAQEPLTAEMCADIRALKNGESRVT